MRIGEAWQNILVLTGIVLGVTGLTLGLVAGLPFFGTLERWAADYRIATVLPPEKQQADIVMIAINEETLEQFPYRSPVDRRFLSGLLRILEAKGVRGILLDVLLDQPSEADKDAELKETLATLTVPVMVSYARQPESLDDKQVAYLDAFLRPDQRGFANLLKDRFDETVRWIYPGRDVEGAGFVPGVVSGLLKKLGLPPFEGQTVLAYRGGPKPGASAFRSFPAHKAALMPAAWLKGKIALIGEDVSLTDRHRSPFAAAFEGNEGALPGFIFFAYALAQALDHRSAPDTGPIVSGLILALFATLGAALGKIDMALWLRVTAALVIVGGLWVGGFYLLRYGGVLVPLVMPSLGLGAALWMTDAYTGRQERRRKKFVQGAFARYLSPSLLQEIVKDPTKLSLVARRREMSFIFTDIAGFTTISEKIDAQALSVLLNTYFEGMCSIIFRHGGIVDKFIGDAIFAIFNAVEDREDHARSAVACAQELDAFAFEFLGKQTKRRRAFGVTRIGVHTGWANIGNYGSKERFEFTALGDAVNTAARLEGLNKYFGTRLCVSDSTARRCPDLSFRPLGKIVLKGKTLPIGVFEPLDAERAASDFIRRYLEAYEVMDSGGPAEPLFRSLKEMAPHDGCVAVHIKRLAAGERSSYLEMAEK